MDAQTGIGFLKILFRDGRADGTNIEKAIEIAGSKSPSASFDAAALHARLHGKDQMTSLTFAKGTRWLAVLRRDEGEEAFKKSVVELRNMVASTNTTPTV